MNRRERLERVRKLLDQTRCELTGLELPANLDLEARMKLDEAAATLGSATRLLPFRERAMPIEGLVPQAG